MRWKTIKSLHLARSSVLHESMRSSAVVAQATAHRLIARKPLREATMRSGRLSIAIAGRNDEVRRPESTKQVHMTTVEHATKNEDMQCLRRDVTEVDVSRRSAGRTRLMFVVISRGVMSTLQWSRTETNVCWETTCRHAVRIAMAVCCAEVLFQPSFSLCCSTRCLWKTRHPTRWLWYGLGTEHAAYHGTSHCTD